MATATPIPVKPTAKDHHSEHHVRLHERIFQGLGLLKAGANITISWDGQQYIIAASARSGVSPTGYMGEYDQTKAYESGQQFIISAPLTIAGTVLPKGLYGVRPASSETDTQTFGPWAGTLPANPATSGIDMDKLFFIPANTFPTLAAAPNNKLYAELIAELC